jgi:hypothetical protein
MKNNISSKFDVVEETDKYTYIEDRYDGNPFIKSVTNDVENVVKYLYKHFNINDKRLFYKDTDGKIDEILHENGEFIDFKLGAPHY